MTAEAGTAAPPAEGSSGAAGAALVAAIEAAGVAVDAPGRAWLGAVAAALAEPGDFVVAAGFGGHELALLDFDAAAAERVRGLARLVATPAAPDLLTGLAVTGSAAQNRIQPFPADVDFFERVHLLAPTRRAAERRLAEVVRAEALRLDTGAGIALEEVWFGRLPDGWVPTQAHRFGSALAWRRAEVVAGEVGLRAVDGATVRLGWGEAAAEPGVVKLDWLVTDPKLGGPCRVQKVIDPTWQDPAGAIVGLDGLVDGEYQQIYLGAEGAALAARLAQRGAAAGGRARYVAAMEAAVVGYARGRPPDFGKVAKRLYNLCRLTGRWGEALLVRDLFAAPPARLHRMRAAVDVFGAGCGSDRVPDGLAALLDDLEGVLTGDAAGLAAVAACRTGAGDARAVRSALCALDVLLADRASDAFRSRLLAAPAIAALLAELEARYPAG